MDHAIETERLTCRYGRTRAVADLTMRVPTGSIYALLGPNGAGKTHDAEDADEPAPAGERRRPRPRRRFAGARPGRSRPDRRTSRKRSSFLGT